MSDELIPQPSKSNRLLMVVVAVLLVAVVVMGVLIFWNNQKENTTNENTAANTTSNTPSVGNISTNGASNTTNTATNNTTNSTNSTGSSGTTTSKSVALDVSGHSYEFSTPELRASQGDTVTITFHNEGGTHDLVVDGYDVGTKEIGTGDTASVTFVASKKGTFEFYCSVENHRERGMTGTLIVE